METTTDHDPPFKVSLGRFVARISFLRHIKSILCWENKVHSTLLLLLYTFICLYPVLLLAIPLAIFVFLTFYQERKSKHHLRSDSATETHPPSSIGDDVLRETEFQNNLKFLQSFFDHYCVLHDTIINLVSRIKKSKSQKWTKLDGVLVSTLLISILGWVFTPFFLRSSKLVAMFLGWFVLTFFSPLIQTLLKCVRNWIPLPPAPRPGTAPLTLSTQRAASEKCVEVYENQRWWFGLGFQPLLLSDERPNWSNHDGTVTLPSKESLSPPIGYLFNSTNWKIDPSWTATDNEGWVYMDHFWKNQSPTPRMVSVTRSRKWIRSIVSVQ